MGWLREIIEETILMIIIIVIMIYGVLISLKNRLQECIK